MRKLNGLDEMSEMVEMWLSKRYDVKHFGNPSWQKLVSAVGSKAGAGDVAAAEDIASKHSKTLKCSMSYLEPCLPYTYS